MDKFAINRYENSWQGFQDVVRTMVWKEVAADLRGEKLGEIEDDIREIGELLSS